MLPFQFKRLGPRVRFRPVSPPASILVRLPDHRTIAVEEYGDPCGPPVLYFHGWPASRLEAGLISGLPVRLLALDRPGYGRSTVHPERTLQSWAQDVAVVADRLNLTEFYLVGLSGGAPFAAAVAEALPDRVRGMTLVSPVPPPDLVPERTPGIGHLFRLGRYPRLAQRLFTVARPLLRQRIITPRTVVGRGLPEADRAVMNRTTMVGLGVAWREGFRRGIEGALSDARIYARPWGVNFAAITVPTSLWFGSVDSLIPIETLEPYRAIPGIRWHVLSGEGHYSLPIRHARQILAELTRTVQLSSSLSQ